MEDRFVAIVRERSEQSIAAQRAFAEGSALALARAAHAVAHALRRGGTLFLFGNGGSAADAQHVASEFTNRLERDRPALAALALTTDTSAITSIANDDAYDRIFARQIEALGRAGDVALGISTSGNSPNVASALQVAAERGMLTVAFLGRDGGKCRQLAEHALVVTHPSTQRIQETHIFMGHLLAELVEEVLHFGSDR